MLKSVLLFITVTVDSCMYPLNIPHATVLRVGLQSSVYSLGSQVAYSCHSDYQLVGDAVFTCRADGCWDPDILPVCHPRHPTSHFYSECFQGMLLKKVIASKYNLCTLCKKVTSIFRII